MIEYIKGDLLSTDIKIIVHGCNCQGVMGSGIARQIKAKYPEVYTDYKLWCDVHTHNRGQKSSDILGTIVPVDIGDKVLINALTQDYYGRDGKQYTDYTAIINCMRSINLYLCENNLKEIAMPKIGCGLGGGNWNTISRIIIEELPDINVYVYELEQ